MKNVYVFSLLAMFAFMIVSCSRKTTPDGTDSRSVYGSGNTTTTTSTSTTTTPSKPVAKKIKTPTPKAITVNDASAKKTFDGRYYYDLEGHRYWKNNRDGKYYIYSKSMNTDPDFKKPE